MILEQNQTFLFIGDSITDVNRRMEGCKPLGHGYPFLVAALLAAKFPERNIRFLNQGISGNTILDLSQRWDTDVLAHKPDWISILIGINDAHRLLQNPQEQSLSPEAFAETYRALIQKTVVKIGTRFILLEPFYIHPDLSQPVRVLLKKYQDAVRSLAQEFSTLFISTQREFDSLLHKQPVAYWSEDSVHPNAAGHGVLARLVLDALHY